MADVAPSVTHILNFFGKMTVFSFPGHHFCLRIGGRHCGLCAEDGRGCGSEREHDQGAAAVQCDGSRWSHAHLGRPTARSLYFSQTFFLFYPILFIFNKY